MSPSLQKLHKFCHKEQFYLDCLIPFTLIGYWYQRSWKSRAKIKIMELDFRRPEIGVCRHMIGRVHWKTLERKGAKESLLIFKDHLFWAEEPSISINRKSTKNSRRPALMTTDFLTKCKCKKEARRGWKEEQAIWNEYRNTTWACNQHGLPWNPHREIDGVWVGCEGSEVDWNLAECMVPEDDDEWHEI